MKRKTASESPSGMAVTPSHGKMEHVSRNALRTRLACEKMLVDISSRAIHIGHVQNFLHGCVQRMGKTLDVDGIFVWFYDSGSDTLSNVSEWVAEGFPTYKEKLQNFQAKAFPWSMALMRKNQIINFKNIEDIPEGKEKEIMRMIGIKSILIIPLFIKGVFYGAIGFEVYRYHRKWLNEDISILKTASRIISKSIESYLAEKEIEKAREELETRVLARTAELKMAIKELEHKHNELLAKKAELEKVNAALMATNNALSVLARNFEREKREIQNGVAHTINTRIMPFITRLQTEEMEQKCQARLDVLVTHIHELAEELDVGKNIFSSLSTAEACIAAMVKNGLTSGEIARQLSISPETVKTHRRNIRKKLNLKNRKINLRTYLRSRWDKKST